MGINLYYTRQPHPAGLGDAIYRARSFVGEEPFVVMLGDDLMKDKVTLTKHLMNKLMHPQLLLCRLRIRKFPSTV